MMKKNRKLNKKLSAVLIKNLRKFREKTGLSHAQLTAKLKVSKSVTRNYELGYITPSLSRLIEIANVLNVSLDELVRDQTQQH